MQINIDYIALRKKQKKKQNNAERITHKSSSAVNFSA